MLISIDYSYKLSLPKGIPLEITNTFPFLPFYLRPETNTLSSKKLLALVQLFIIISGLEYIRFIRQVINQYGCAQLLNPTQTIPVVLIRISLLRLTRVSHPRESGADATAPSFFRTRSKHIQQSRLFLTHLLQPQVSKTSASVSRL